MPFVAHAITCFLYRLHVCIILKSKISFIEKLHGRISRRTKADSSTVCSGVFQNTVSFDFLLALGMNLHFEVQAKELVDFWLDHLKAQLDTRFAFTIEPHGTYHNTLEYAFSNTCDMIFR